MTESDSVIAQRCCRSVDELPLGLHCSACGVGVWLSLFPSVSIVCSRVPVGVSSAMLLLLSVSGEWFVASKQRWKIGTNFAGTWANFLRVKQKDSCF